MKVGRRVMASKPINIGCVCGCGMGSSLLLKMLVSGVLDEYKVKSNVDCYDSGTVAPEVDMIVTSSAFYDGLKAQFGDKIPVICIKNFSSKEEMEEKLREIGII
jgi:PTS system ascorbate-specific IIB component